MTDFLNSVTGGSIDDSADQVRRVVRFIDDLLANGDEITILSDRSGRLFKPNDPPELWRSLLERYSSAEYEVVHPAGDQVAAYNYKVGAGSECFRSPVAVVLVEPGSFMAVHRWMTGNGGPADILDIVRIGCRLATNDGLICVLRSWTLPPSSHDIHAFLVNDDSVLEFIAGADIVWFLVKSSEVEEFDTAEFHLQHMETTAKYARFGKLLGSKLAVLRTCERYGIGLQVGCWGFTLPDPPHGGELYPPLTFGEVDKRFKHEVNLESPIGHAYPPSNPTLFDPAIGLAGPDAPRGDLLAATPLVPLHLRDFPDLLWRQWRRRVGQVGKAGQPRMPD